MFSRASATYAEHRLKMTVWEDFVRALNAKNVCLVPHCLGGECEETVKELSKRREDEAAGVPEDSRAPSMGAKSLCIPFEQPEGGIVPGETKCISPKCGAAAQKWVLFGRSY